MSEPLTITIELPLPPKMTHPNGRTTNHIAKAGQINKQKSDACFAARKAMKKAKFAGPMKAAFIQSHWRVGGQNDQDNLIGWLKATYDGIVLAGLIGDDKNVTHLPPVQFVSRKKEDAKNRGVTLVITEASE
jgi:hypothetical protein